MNKFTLHNPKPESKGPEVDLSALEAFTSGAKDRRGADEGAPPWEKYDPEAKRHINMTIRMNEHELEMLRYLSQISGISQHKILARQVLPVLKQMALAEYEARRSQPKVNEVK